MDLFKILGLVVLVVLNAIIWGVLITTAMCILKL